jgi:hypothetical protein
MITTGIITLLGAIALAREYRSMMLQTRTRDRNVPIDRNILLTDFNFKHRYTLQTLS